MRQPALFVLPLLLFACRGSSPDEGTSEGPATSISSGAATAEAAIEAKSGSRLTGRALFTELSDGGTLVEVWLNGAPPGLHAVHVHEFGDCSAADGTSAGGHFNPDGHHHGGPKVALHHAGDLGNMFVEADGSGYHVLPSSDLTVAPGSHSVRGRAIVVHAGVDDLLSQPSGAAGGRIGCGEIH